MSARDLFDQGIALLGYFNSPRDLAAANRAFRAALQYDPDLCDAWMGLAATGEITVEVFENAARTASTLHRETRRVGLADTALAPTVTTPMFIEMYPSTRVGLRLAHIATLINSDAYDHAEQQLNTVDVSTEPALVATHRFLGATLYTVTRRWPDVLEWTSRPVPSLAGDTHANMTMATYINIVTTLLTADAHIGLAEFSTALATLDEFNDQISKIGLAQGASDTQHIAARAALSRGLCQRRLGNETLARNAFSAASVNGTLIAEAAAALPDPTYGPATTTAAAIAARIDRWDHASGPTADELHTTQQRADARQALDDADTELQDFIGLDEIKDHIHELKAVQIFDQKMAARDIQIGERPALHASLEGPPGTGKTSIARIITRMYYGLGILDSPEVIEVSRPDLVGGVIGETEAKTKPILENARGKALFIDEAPTLYIADNERDFGRIAIDIIMKFAEDHRHDTVIFLAGYANKMDELYSHNPGFRGRFPNKLVFRSNNPAEMTAIAEMFAEKAHLTLAPDARSTFESTAHWLCTTASPDPEIPLMIDYVNNGRFARTVIEAATRMLKIRLVSDDSIDLDNDDLDHVTTITTTITEADMKSALHRVLRANNTSPCDLLAPNALPATFDNPKSLPR